MLLYLQLLKMTDDPKFHNQIIQHNLYHPIKKLKWINTHKNIPALTFNTEEAISATWLTAARMYGSYSDCNQ